MFIGDYNISKEQLINSTHKNLLRLAKYIKLKYNLTEMSHRQLAKLVRWKFTRGQIRW
jgi:hypothetical protein